MNKIAFGAVAAIAVVSIVANVGLYYRYSSNRPLFEVGDKVIRLKNLNDRLNYLYSTNILRGMIVNDVIMEEAAKEGVVPSAQDVADAKEHIQRTNPSLISQAKADDPDLTIFDEELLGKLALRNLEIKNIKVSEAEITNYYNQHKANYMLPAQTNSTVVFAKDSVGADRATQMLKDGTDPKIIAQTPGLAVLGINTTVMPSIPKEVVGQVLALKVGDIQTYDVQGLKMIVRPTATSAQGIQPLSLIHDQVATDVKLQKALPESDEVAKLVHDTHITVEDSQYAGAVPKGALN